MKEEGGDAAIDDVAVSLARIESKLNAMLGLIDNLNAKMTRIDTRLNAVEYQLGHLDDLIADKVREISTAMNPMREDIHLLERKADDMKQQMGDIKSSIGQDDDNKCAVIRTQFPHH